MKSLLLLLALYLPCNARIGETLGELKMRYGEPVKSEKTLLPNFTHHVFNKNGLTITVGVLGDTSAEESFEKVTEVQAMDIMLASGGRWALVTERDGGKLWKRGTTIGFLNAAGVLYIATPEARAAADKIAKLKSGTKGVVGDAR